MFLVRIPLSEVSFTRGVVMMNNCGVGSGGAAEVTLSPQVLAALPIQAVVEDNSRKLPLKNMNHLHASGERGVALVSDRSGKILVLDIEADDDEEDEDSEEEEENEADADNDSADVTADSGNGSTIDE